MKQHNTLKRRQRQQHNMQLVDNRFQLLDTIHTMIDDELERRAHTEKHDVHAENPPPAFPSSPPSPLHRLWLRIASLFTSCTHRPPSQTSSKH